MKLNLRLAAPLAAVAVIAAGGAAFAATAAPAATVPVIDNTNGVVGYSAVQNGSVTYFTHQGGQYGLGDPQYSLSDPQLPYSPLVGALVDSLHEGRWTPHFSNTTGVTVKAVRMGLCGGTRSFNAGTTVQELLVPDSATTYAVVAVAGQFAGTSGDACQSGDLPSGEATLLLRHIPDRDTLHADLMYDGRSAHNGTHAGYATFVATDMSHPAGNTNQVSTPGKVFLGGNGTTDEFYEAEDGLLGVTGDASSSLSGPVVLDVSSPNMVAREAHILLNGNDISTDSEVSDSLQSGAFWDVQADATVQGSTVTGGVSAFKSDHTSFYTAPGVFPVVVG